MAEDIVGWVGLNRGSRHLPTGFVEVTPVIGVRHQGIERVVAELRGERFHAYIPPTANTVLSELAPDLKLRHWILGDAMSQDDSDDLVKAIELRGLPFMRSASRLSAICDLLDHGVGFAHQIVLRRPVAWQLAGDPARARMLLDLSEQDLNGRDDAAAAELRAFASRFRDQFKAV